jgi:hypothetical protein
MLAALSEMTSAGRFGAVAVGVGRGVGVVLGVAGVAGVVGVAVGATEATAVVATTLPRDEVELLTHAVATSSTAASTVKRLSIPDPRESVAGVAEARVSVRVRLGCSPERTSDGSLVRDRDNARPIAVPARAESGFPGGARSGRASA